ncbi:MAG: dephospho-CoA kinase [Clostridia bacterium]|nr:dephospho-CoA kinase [Clostridia bacterium]
MKTVLGLTGGSGCGKSLAASFLKKHGAEIIDADKIAREILEPGKPALKEIVEAFGGVLLPDGSLNRKKLGNLVFSDEDSLHRLNAITHTYIIDEIKKAVNASQNSFIVIDAPLLLECGLDSLCTACVCVLADKELRKARIMTRDNLTEQEAENRIASQKDDGYYKSRCKFFIENNGDAASLEQSITHILKELLH